MPERLLKRTTRFVCVSDTHNTIPSLPKGDVLIHCGDLTNQGTYSELHKAIEWISLSDFEVKIVIAGIFIPLIFIETLKVNHFKGIMTSP